MGGKHLFPTFIEAHNIPDAQYKLLRRLLEDDKGVTDSHVEWGGRQGQTRREFDSLFLHIRHPEQRPFVEPPPEGCAPVTTMEAIETYFATKILMPGNPDGFKYTYGDRICNQIEHMVEAFKTHGFAHVKSCLTTAVPEDWADGKSQPCLRLIDFKPSFDEKENAWFNHMFIYFRANDGYAAFNENIGGLQLLNEWFVDQIGKHPKTGIPIYTGEIIYLSKSWNVREEVIELAKQRVYL